MKKVSSVQPVDIDYRLGDRRVVVKGAVISKDEEFAYILDDNQGYVELPVEFLEAHNRANAGLLTTNP